MDLFDGSWGIPRKLIKIVDRGKSNENHCRKIRGKLKIHRK
jgi:hypothetical protein